MAFEVTPLRDCIKKHLKYGSLSYHGMTIDEILELTREADSKFGEPPRVSDEARAAAWFAHLELTIRGLAPRSRDTLGEIPISPKLLFQAVRKHDAPYIDLLWLAHQMPDHIPRRWKNFRYLAYREESDLDLSPIEFIAWNPEDIIDLAFADADKAIRRKLPVAKKCMQMKLSRAQQATMRWLCSKRVRDVLKELTDEELAFRKRNEAQKIKQLTREDIDRRVLYWKAWKIAGGGTRWQEAANVFSTMTGEKCSRQGMKDMIDRMSSKKIVVRRRRRKTVEAAISDK